MPLARALLPAMNDAEFERWRMSVIDSLHAFKARAESYLSRRTGRGVFTPTDQAMQRDLVLCDDLLAAMQELPVLRDQGRIGPQQHHGDTGLLLMQGYDPDYDAKPKP